MNHPIPFPMNCLSFCRDKAKATHFPNYRMIRLILWLVMMMMMIGLVENGWTAQWVAKHDMTGDEFQSACDQWSEEPYQYMLISVAGYEKDGQARYAAIWEERPGRIWIKEHGLTQDQYEAATASHAMLGFRPMFLGGFGVGATAYYNAIWVYTPAADVHSVVGMSHDDFESEHSDRLSEGFSLVHLWTYDVGGQAFFAGIWRQGETAQYEVRTRQNPVQFSVAQTAMANQGFQLEVQTSSLINNFPEFTTVWRRPGSSNDQFSFRNLKEQNFQAEIWNGYYQGYRPVSISVSNGSEEERYQVIFRQNGGLSAANLAMINNAIDVYMTTNNIPGLSMAVSRAGRLVYAKGFGLADQKANERVHPHHRFRIASVSKVVTAAAMMRLVDYCGLDLDQTVFGDEGILGNTYGAPYGAPPYTAREEAITVRQLLDHTSGWAKDGIWEISSLDPDNVVDYMVGAHNPVADPGTQYLYLNANHVTAGRVIERLTGKTYEQFCQDELLTPSCATGMELGGFSMDQRKPNEVVYYGDGAYSLALPRMDASSSWIARPMDLLLMQRRIDGDSAQADLISSASLTDMRTPTLAPGPSGGGTNYGLGLKVFTTWSGHNGCMSGTIAYLVQRNDGLALAVTCNFRPAGDSCAGGIRNLINNLVTTIENANEWPTLDLFPCTIPAGDPPPGLEDPHEVYVDGSCAGFFPNGQKQCLVFGGPWHTVNQAVNHLCLGDSLFIRSGSYNETVLFNRYSTVRSYDGTAIIGK